jgi:RNA polymerase sigma factor (sigma-70 family)
MMATVAAPPFESFYLEHRDVVFAFLVRRLGRDAAEDAFQETFLRALRGYDRLRHTRELRAWVFTIAARIVADEHRRRARQPVPTQPEAVVDGRPAFAELDDLAGELPPKERTAVVLRYGYDLAYADIAVALGSTEEAARQAASSGVRRLRRKGIADARLD